MLWIQIKIALRHYARSKVMTLINLMGLIVSLVAFFFIAIYLKTELTFDNFHPNAKNIFRVNTDIISPDEHLQLAVAGGPVGPTMVRDYPEVKGQFRLAKPWTRLLVTIDRDRFYEEQALYADSSFLSLTGFNLIAGETKTALSEINQVILTTSIADKYFRDDVVLGKSIDIDGRPFQITGIIEDPPSNSTFQFKMLLSFQNWISEHPATEVNWTWLSTVTFVILDQAQHVAKINKQLQDFADTYFPSESRYNFQIGLEPLRDIHFNTERLSTIGTARNRSSLYLLLAVAIFILTLAVINFINLTTAKAHTRSLEIGIRKTFGAARKSIAAQILVESCVLAFAAIVGACLILWILWPEYQNFVGIDGQITQFVTPLVIFGLILLGFILSLASGFYPAIIISNLNPTTIFKDQGMNSKRSGSVRFILSIAQFFISTGLIIATLTIWDQTVFLSNYDMGFEQNHKVVMEFGDLDLIQHGNERIKNEFETNIPGAQVTFSSHVPGESPHQVITTIQDETGQDRQAEIDLYFTDFDFIEDYELEIIAGRSFDAKRPTDSSALIINESAVKLLGFKNPIQILDRDYVQWMGEGKVIGVIKDFHHKSLHDQISPLSLQINAEMVEKFTVSLDEGSLSHQLKDMEQIWVSLYPTLPFTYRFLDESIGQLYKSELLFLSIFRFFGILSILIACIGLLGLSTFACQQKAREISIRKVFGASGKSILTLLIKQFMKPILFACLLSLPITYLVLSRWMDNFAQQTGIRPSVFIMGILIVLTISLGTIIINVTRAASREPSAVLRGK